MRKFTCQCGRSANVPDTSELHYCRCGQIALDYIQCDDVEHSPQARPSEPATPRREKCQHRGEVLRDVPCGCAGRPKIFACAVHGECIVKKLAHEAAKPFKCCQECTDWLPVG